MTKILKRTILHSTPWVDFYEIQTEGTSGNPDSFYAIRQPDYITVFAQTPSGRIPLVKQFRPAVGEVTYELPAGTLEEGETAEAACRREILEETGHHVLKLTPLGIYFPDTGRSMHQQHTFYASIDEAPVAPPTELGIAVEYYTDLEVRDLIRNGIFRHQLHISVFLLRDLLKKD